MSKPNDTRPPADATTQHGYGDPDEAAKHTEASAYEAPYHHHEKTRVPGQYIVVFHPNHTLANHFAVVGYEFELIYSFSSHGGYIAALDERMFDTVRRDHGVKFIEDNVGGGKLEG
jgi:hypothetical protein